MAVETIQSLMEQLGPTVPEIDQIVQMDTGGWGILLETGETIGIEWSEAPPRLIFTTSLGIPVEERKVEMFRLALAFNMHSFDTGGAKIALSGEDDEMVLMYEMPREQVSLENVGKFVTWFNKQAKPWRDFVVSTDVLPPAAGVDVRAMV